jgi:hypothetical protein
VFRTGVAWFDIPESQVALSDLLLDSPRSDTAERVSAREGKAIGLMALGRPSQALAQLDSAAALSDDKAARLEQAEWRVVLRAMGLPIADSGGWHSRLAALAEDSVLGPRAAWALALSAYARGDTVEGKSWRTRLRAVVRARPLERFLVAMEAAGRSEWQAALALTDSVEIVFNASEPPDPFARAVFHMQRGMWHAAGGDALAADREWLWYEGSDIEGWPRGLAQAGEIDGMLGVYARLLRGQALLRPEAAGGVNRARGCAYLRRVMQLWSGAEPAFATLKAQADSLLRRCAP